MAAPPSTLETTQLLKGVMDLVVLAALSRADGYGYDVVRRLRVAGLGEIGDASVYGTLRRLFSQGLVTSYLIPSDEGPARKYYGLTKLGHKALDAHTTQWNEFAATIGEIVSGDALSSDEALR
jgi:PadR family transcriptional regulator, regulatory protein PadR